MGDDAELIRAYLARVKEGGLSDREAGEAIGKTTQWFWKIKRAKTKKLTADTRRKVADWLGLQPARLSPSYAEGVAFAVGRVREALAELDRLSATTPSAPPVGPTADGKDGPQLDAVVASDAHLLAQPKPPEVKKGTPRSKGPRRA